MRRTVLIIKEHAVMNPNKEQAQMWWMKSLWDSGSKATAKNIRDRGRFLHNPLQELFQTACVLRHRLLELNCGLCEEDPWNASGLLLKCHPVITKVFFWDHFWLICIATTSANRFVDVDVEEPACFQIGLTSKTDCFHMASSRLRRERLLLVWFVRTFVCWESPIGFMHISSPTDNNVPPRPIQRYFCNRYLCYYRLYTATIYCFFWIIIYKSWLRQIYVGHWGFSWKLDTSVN